MVGRGAVRGIGPALAAEADVGVGWLEAGVAVILAAVALFRVGRRVLVVPARPLMGNVLVLDAGREAKLTNINKVDVTVVIDEQSQTLSIMVETRRC